ncbi:aminopeptidase [Geobacter argillaceus]|uniref:Leucyl aminopeptidase (Aminopeptidase T) n=1 Tax=Geobacter argillaceus TaxID=345631 RepID=A0A562WSW7_9BACT|nr:aminopeptidase [Geobacter argillaceus]TWJ33391.1 leucyl aminopeptidase (aminopeptidase T) [Geobacter argillaceus]
MTDFEEAFGSLFTVNMGVRPGERIVVFSDTIRDDEHPSPDDRERRERLFAAAGGASRFAAATYGDTCFEQFPATSGSGAEPPEHLWRAVFGDAIVDSLAAAGLLKRLIAKEASTDDLAAAREMVVAGREAVAEVVVALANNSTSHTRFRALANAAGTRYASLPHFDPAMFFTSMQVDWLALAERTRLLGEAVNRAVELLVTTSNGTQMRFGKQGRIAKGDDGLLTMPGSFGNLPAGEVYLAPLEGTASGTMVLEYAPTRKLVTPLTLIVENGEVVDIRGDEPHREILERKFAESRLNRNIAELGIGTNDRASRPDNILEAEKILGTIHIALGDNAGFGGRISTPFHEDYVFYKPTVTAVDANGTQELLIAKGTLLVR